MKTFTSMKKAEAFINESGYYAVYLMWKSKYRVFKTVEDKNAYATKEGI